MSVLNASFTLGVIDLPPHDRELISGVLEEGALNHSSAWLLLYTDSCNLIITDRNSAHQASHGQIVAHVYDPDEVTDEQYALKRPLRADDIKALLTRAQNVLSRQGSNEASQSHSGLSVRPAGANRLMRKANPLKRPLVLDELAQDTPQQTQSPTSFATNMAQPSSQDLPDNAMHSIAESWADVAIALYSIQRNSPPAIVRIEVPDRGIVTLDFRYRVFTCEGNLADFPLVPHLLKMQIEIVQEGHPIAVDPAAAKSLDQFLWFVGKNAFGNAQAPWICREDRFRLHRWPNFTELQHSMEQMRLTAALGNRFLSVDELNETVDIPHDVIVRTVNAYSLMGLLKTSPVAPELESSVREKARSAPAKKRSLFGKLIGKLGL